MPWDELKPRRWPAFDRELKGISSQTMEDHFKLYEGYARKANECRRILHEFDYSEIEGNQVYSPRRVPAPPDGPGLCDSLTRKQKRSGSVGARRVVAP